MTIDLRGRHFLKEIDFSRAEFAALLDLAAILKTSGRNRTQHLLNQNIALIFEKTSTRTRAAFEVAAHHQGANVTYIDPVSSQIGHKESIQDTGRVLSRFFDGIEFRGSSQDAVEELAANSRVPVFNGLTDDCHPTQMLADFLTMREHANTKDDSSLSYAYLGDARNNMGNSLLITGALMGADVRIAAPKDLWPDVQVRETAQGLALASGARITITEDVAEAVKSAQFIHTDVWVSMGEPKDVWASRIAALTPYRVTSDTLKLTGRSDAKFMHCLPAYHDLNTAVGRQVAKDFSMLEGIEVSQELFESEASIVFDQAENRLHTIEAILVATMSDVETSNLIGQP